MNDSRLKNKDPKLKAADSDPTNDYVYYGYFAPGDRINKKITIARISDVNERFMTIGYGLWSDRETINYTL